MCTGEVGRSFLWRNGTCGMHQEMELRYCPSMCTNELSLGQVHTAWGMVFQEEGPCKVVTSGPLLQGGWRTMCSGAQLEQGASGCPYIPTIDRMCSKSKKRKYKIKCSTPESEVFFLPQCLSRTLLLTQLNVLAVIEKCLKSNPYCRAGTEGWMWSWVAGKWQLAQIRMGWTCN